MAQNNKVYSYDIAQDQWSDLMPGPGHDVTFGTTGFFQWYPDGFYYLNDYSSTMHVYRNGQWSSFAIGGEGSCAGTYDDDNQEIYIRTYSDLGFKVIDTTNDTVVRTIVDLTDVSEHSRSGSYVGGYFYTREFSGSFQRFDGNTGDKTSMLGTPTSVHTATDTDFETGNIYVSGYGDQSTVFQVYDPSNDEMIDLASSPMVHSMTTITVMRF
jgi:hypothetical protein